MGYSVVLGNRKFSALLLGQIISLLGDVILGVALYWYVFTLKGTATAVSYLSLAFVVPNLIFSLLGGPLVDRWNRRRIMMSSDLLRCLAILFIPALYELGGLSLTALYVIVFVSGSASAFFLPARSAIIPQIFHDKDQLTSANSLMNGAFEAIRTVGQGISGVVIGLVTAIGTAALDSLTFLISAISILAMGTIASPPKSGRDQQKGVVGVLADVSEGFAYVWKNFVIRVVLISSLLGNFFITIGYGFSVVYAKDALSTNLLGYGILSAAVTVGTVSGSLLVGKVKFRKHLGRTLILSSILMGAAIVVLSPQTSIFAAIPLIVLFGLCLAIYNVNYVNMLQATVPNELLGRVMSLDQIISFAITPIAFAIGGPLVDLIGIRIAYLLSGGAVMVIGSVTFVSRRFRTCSY